MKDDPRSKKEKKAPGLRKPDRIRDGHKKPKQPVILPSRSSRWETELPQRIPVGGDED